MSELRTCRQRRGLSQDEMADITGISRSTYSKLERGLIDNPPLRYLINCAIVLGYDVSELVEEEWLEWMVFKERRPEPASPKELWTIPDDGTGY